MLETVIDLIKELNPNNYRLGDKVVLPEVAYLSLEGVIVGFALKRKYRSNQHYLRVNVIYNYEGNWCEQAFDLNCLRRLNDS